MAPIEMYGSFLLTGTGIPMDRLTESLGIEPSKTWRKGDPVAPGAILGHKEDGWYLRTENFYCLDLQEPLADLLRRIRPCREAIVRLKRQYNLEAQVSVIAYPLNVGRPMTVFEADLINEIAAIGAIFNLDLITGA